jgi:hypothetical protein
METQRGVRGAIIILTFERLQIYVGARLHTLEMARGDDHYRLLQYSISSRCGVYLGNVIIAQSVFHLSY